MILQTLSQQSQLLILKVGASHRLISKRELQCKHRLYSLLRDATDSSQRLTRSFLVTSMTLSVPRHVADLVWRALKICLEVALINLLVGNNRLLFFIQFIDSAQELRKAEIR